MEKGKKGRKRRKRKTKKGGKVRELRQCCTTKRPPLQPRSHTRNPRTQELALWYLHHPAWVEGHTGGSRSIPTAHPCGLRSGGCGWLSPHALHEPKQQTPRKGEVPHGSGAGGP